MVLQIYKQFLTRTEKAQVFGNYVFVVCLDCVGLEKQKRITIGFVNLVETSLKCNE